MTITCADCGSTQIIPPLPPRAIAQCHRCDRLLDRRRWTRFDVTLAAAFAALILLPPAVMLPLLESTFRNLLYERTRLVSSVPAIYHDVWFPLAFGFFVFAFIFPALRAFLMVVVLGSIRWDVRVPELGRLFRLSEELRTWSMTDVVAIAGIIAYFRAAIPADVDPLIGAWCYAAAAILALLADYSLDRRGIWNSILRDPSSHPDKPMVSCAICELAVDVGQRGRPCPRCGATLDPDIARRFIPAAAALAAALPLTLPAFSFAVIVNEQLAGVLEHTILGTVQMLADMGYWEFGVILLLAGVLIPILAMVILFWLLARVRFPSRDGLVMRTRVYRVLKKLVRWPMIIPFIAAIAAPIVDYRNLDDILAGPGATPFFALVVLIMLAVRLFEPRLMWRTAGEVQ